MATHPSSHLIITVLRHYLAFTELECWIGHSRIPFLVDSHTAEHVKGRAQQFVNQSVTAWRAFSER